MKKEVNKECKYIIMSCTIIVILPGWCTNYGKYIHALFTYSENIYFTSKLLPWSPHDLV